jgi:hypothetical protein
LETWISIVISLLALSVSGVTAWLTLFKKGKLLMTQPTSIFFGPDGGVFERTRNKVYLRTLLYSSSRKGQVIARVGRNKRSALRRMFSSAILPPCLTTVAPGIRAEPTSLPSTCCTGTAMIYSPDTSNSCATRSGPFSSDIHSPYMAGSY